MEEVNFWLSVVGNITSIIGFGITIAILFSIRNIKAYYLAKVTMPQQLVKLKELRENIEQQLIGRYENQNKEKIFEFSTEANINVRNLSLKVKEFNKLQYSRQVDSSVKVFKESYELFRSSKSKESARNMNRNLFEFLRSVELVLNDETWSRTQ